MVAPPGRRRRSHRRTGGRVGWLPRTDGRAAPGPALVATATALGAWRGSGGGGGGSGAPVGASAGRRGDDQSAWARRLSGLLPLCSGDRRRRLPSPPPRNRGDPRRLHGCGRTSLHELMTLRWRRCYCGRPSLFAHVSPHVASPLVVWRDICARRSRRAARVWVGVASAAVHTLPLPLRVATRRRIPRRGAPLPVRTPPLVVRAVRAGGQPCWRPPTWVTMAVAVAAAAVAGPDGGGGGDATAASTATADLPPPPLPHQWHPSPMAGPASPPLANSPSRWARLGRARPPSSISSPAFCRTAPQAVP